MQSNKLLKISGAAFATFLAVLATPPKSVYATQPLETETARPLKKGAGTADIAYEYQTSSEGHEAAIPLALEYGITDRLEILAEPVPYTAIRPKHGAHSTGAGDTETTLTYLLKGETASAPALALAGEVKFPTAKKNDIGTGKTDYNLTLIASKKYGAWDTHFNVGYSVLGEPAGMKLKNIWNYALAGEYRLNSKYELVGEILGDTESSAKAGDAGATAGAREAAGGEFVCMLGARYNAGKQIILGLGITYDNNQAFLLRPGLTWEF